MKTAQGKTAGDGGGAKRRGGTRLAGALVGKLTRKALGKRGFAHATIITEWTVIIGEDLARHTRPLKLTFPKGRRNGGTIHIQTTGPMALQLQHLSPLIIDRINSHFGYTAVADVRLVQTPFAEPPRKAAARPAKRPLTPDDQQRIQEVADKVTDPDLRERLERLGRAVYRHSPATKLD